MMIKQCNQLILQKHMHTPNWPQIPDRPHRILITGGSGSGKTNLMLNVIRYQPDIDKMYLYAEDPYDVKYQFLINKWQSTGLKHFNDSKAFIEYSSGMNDIYKKIEKRNPTKKHKILIVFDDIIADMLCNKKLNPALAELFVKGRELKISHFYQTIKSCCVKKYSAKLWALFYHENSKQTRTSTNCI